LVVTLDIETEFNRKGSDRRKCVDLTLKLRSNEDYN